MSGMGMKVKLVAVIALGLAQTACYTTRVVSNQPVAGPEYTDRQWFTIGGLANLSGPAGRECQNGIAMAKSKMGVVDMLINVGMTLGGGLLGAAACGDDDAATRASCATAGATLVPFMLATRTVEYSCIPGGAGASWAPEAASEQKAPVAEAPAAAPATAPADAPRLEPTAAR